jgi:hypothetical protein
MPALGICAGRKPETAEHVVNCLLLAMQPPVHDRRHELALGTWAQHAFGRSDGRRCLRGHGHFGNGGRVGGNKPTPRPYLPTRLPLWVGRHMDASILVAF